MRSAEPPRIARWILNHFGSSSNNAAVIGDLDERYHGGCSAAWYWHQVVVAIVVSVFKEVWNHKILTLRAIVVGSAVFVVSRYGFRLTVGRTTHLADVWELLSALASWSRFWRHDWITLAAQIPEVVLSGVLAGWLVARLHRQSQKAMVLAYATYFAGAQIMWLLPEFLRFRSYPFISEISFITLTTVGILVGGGVFSSRRDEDRSEGSCATV
jgi:hypothetical protein